MVPKKEKPLSPWDPLYQPLREMAQKAFDAVKGRSYGRVDLRLDKDGKIYALEVNDLCSVGVSSYFAMSIEQSGHSRTEVFEKQIYEALQRKKI